MLRTLMIAFALGLATPACAEAPAAAPAEIGLADGARVGAQTLISSSGDTVALSDLAGDSGTVIAFVRSVVWCPFCKTQLAGLEAAAAPLQAKGWRLIAVSYDAPEKLADFKADRGLSFELYADTDSAVIRAFNLLNAEMQPGSRTYGIPHPAIVFVGADGTLKKTLREEGYRDRPAVEAVLEVANGF